MRVQNLLNELEQLLQQDQSLTDQNGQLIKNAVIDRAARLDHDLLALLMQSEPIKAHFFTPVGETMVFDKVRFQQFIANKAFLPDSYTAFRNKIGLTDHSGHFLSAGEDVVLAWPYKDCVIEGGMTKEDVKRDEIFWNIKLASDDITRLYEPKALTGLERWDVDAVAKAKPKLVGRIAPATDNLLIKGNNLLALHSLKRRYAGEVKLIYIDPPYNTGGDGFRYNDRFNHSAWLTFMRNRLEVAKELLRPDGAIFVNLDDNEAHYAKVLMDEVFGRENFVSNVVWQKKFSPQNDAKWISSSHDHVLCFAKNRAAWHPRPLPRSEAMDQRYANPDNDPRGPWISSDITRAEHRDRDYWPLTTPSGREVLPAPGRSWSRPKENIEQLKADGRLWFGPRGNNMPRMKIYLFEMEGGVTPQSLWLYGEVGSTQDAKRELIELVGAEWAGKFTPKPERLIERIVHLATEPGDLVLDFFLGSGTTAAVAHKMGRRWVGVDQMDYVSDVTVNRIKKVIEGEQGGISKTHNWQGGGSFIYIKLSEANETFANRIHHAADVATLERVAADLRDKGWWRYKVDQTLWDWEQWSALGFDERKQLLLDSLDANHLYVNYGDIDDTDAGLSAEDIAVTKAFYEDEA